MASGIIAHPTTEWVTLLTISFAKFTAESIGEKITSVTIVLIAVAATLQSLLNKNNETTNPAIINAVVMMVHPYLKLGYVFSYADFSMW